MAAAAAEGAAAPVAAAMRAVLARAGRAAERSGRAAEAVRVVAIGKTKPVSLLRQLYDAGHRSFGENYVQEFVTKAPQVRRPPDWIGLDWVAGSPSVCLLIDSALFSCLMQLPEDIRWHFVGHLQSNKVKSLVGMVKIFLGVSRLLAWKI